MKARDRYTDEIVEIISFCGTTQRNEDLDRVSYIDSEGQEHSNEKLNYYWDFEPIDSNRNEIDWEQRRFEIAKAAMQGRLSNQYGDIIFGERNFESFAASCVELADVFIAELKKGGSNANG